MRVAIFAYDCIPNAGSDPGLGWQYSQLAAEEHDATIFTRETNREAIEAALADGATPSNYVYLDMPEALGPWKRGQPWFDAIHCLIWLKRAVRMAAELHSQDPFDLSHFVTNSAFWMSGPFHRLRLPHVHGPLTGGERTHPAFRGRTWRRRVAEVVRDRMLDVAVRLPNWQRTMGRSSTVAVASTQTVADRITAANAKQVVTFRPPFLLDRSLRASCEVVREANAKSRHPTVVVSGRQIAWKGQHWAIEAVAEARKHVPGLTLDLIGDGPEHKALTTLIDELGLRAFVTVHRRLSRADERALIARSWALLFPSERDSGSTLLPISMALGTPIVGFNVGVTVEIVGAGGIMVDPSDDSPGRALAKRLVAYLKSPEMVGQLSAAAVDRANELGIEQAKEHLRHWYGLALGRSRLDGGAQESTTHRNAKHSRERLLGQ